MGSDSPTTVPYNESGSGSGLLTGIIIRHAATSCRNLVLDGLAGRGWGILFQTPELEDGVS